MKLSQRDSENGARKFVALDIRGGISPENPGGAYEWKFEKVGAKGLLPL